MHTSSLPQVPHIDHHAEGYVYELARIVSRRREWFSRMFYNKDLHPAIADAFALARPKDWHAVVLEWPHKSDVDPMQLAYTRDERGGEAGRTTRTTIGRYLTRHWGGLVRENDIARIVARHTGGDFEFWTKPEDIVRAVMEGPSSCMQARFSWLNGHHPYDVYSPDLGWKIAVRLDGDDIVSRCLVCEDECGKRFVRSYSRTSGGYTQRDNQMEEWLISKGYTYAKGWGGSRVAQIELNDGTYLMPYIDGYDGAVKFDDDVFVIDCSGDFDAQLTDGHTAQKGRVCDHCGEYHDEEDGIWVGVDEDQWVGGCCDHHYTHVTGRRGEEYYVADDRAVWVGSTAYDERYLGENNIVTLHDGEHAELDDTCCCAITGDYYLSEDCVRVEDMDDYVCQDEAWQCGASDNWYSSNVEPVEVDGVQYHPDHAPEAEDVVLSDCREVVAVSEPICLAKPIRIQDRKLQHFSDIRGWGKSIVPEMVRMHREMLKQYLTIDLEAMSPTGRLFDPVAAWPFSILRPPSVVRTSAV